ncbi:hypothetical protein LOTGIDRAFT_223340 [Lottia gigantea]|uniref:sarcosine oxidasee (formaldehyde-forming) n=1 Tax=Lottia gigantea TaxID=225164 RepID=V3ZJA4_LOTGI|nr:hypothetical protein LOTGIDRAFT_223340 [Lottia gigantea]ESO82440.1 hypothetical protein LOTGIDRAFT_223340 [Lottia gigantea]
MSNTVYDVIVVGAGIEGSSCAYQLAKRGQRTLLLEQYPLPHTLGSSHGATRITRKAYPEDYYTEMMMEGYKLWKEIEKESGVKIFHNCGTLYLGHIPSLDCVEAGLKKHGSPHRVLSNSAVRSEYPIFSVPDDYTGIFDHDGGILMADKAVNTVQSLFKQNGGTLLDAQKVVEIIPGTTATVRTDKGASFSASNIILALGPFTNKLTSKLGCTLPMRVEKISVFYWKEKVPGMHSMESNFPCFIDRTATAGISVYGLPAYEYPGYVKVCLHKGPIVDPEERDLDKSTWVRERMMKYIKERQPWLHPEPSKELTCLYTVSRDGDVILDKLPTYDNIIVAAGFSGHGFKLGPIVGKLVSDMVITNKTPEIFKHFSIDRFAGSSEDFQSKL